MFEKESIYWCQLEGPLTPGGWGGRVVGARMSGKRYTLQATFCFLIIFWDDREK